MNMMCEPRPDNKNDRWITHTPELLLTIYYTWPSATIDKKFKTFYCLKKIVFYSTNKNIILTIKRLFTL